MNKVIILGNITKDLEVKTTSSGKHVLSFSVAVNGYSKDGPTEFIDCVAWEKTADTISKYFSKGRKILVEGELKSRSYQNKSGDKVKVLEVWVTGFDFVDKKETASQPMFEMKEPVITDDDIPF